MFCARLSMSTLLDFYISKPHTPFFFYVVMFYFGWLIKMLRNNFLKILRLCTVRGLLGSAVYYFQVITNGFIVRPLILYYENIFILFYQEDIWLVVETKGEE